MSPCDKVDTGSFLPGSFRCTGENLVKARKNLLTRPTAFAGTKPRQIEENPACQQDPFKYSGPMSRATQITRRDRASRRAGGPQLRASYSRIASVEQQTERRRQPLEPDAHQELARAQRRRRPASRHHRGAPTAQPEWPAAPVPLGESRLIRGQHGTDVPPSTEGPKCATAPCRGRPMHLRRPVGARRWTRPRPPAPLYSAAGRARVHAILCPAGREDARTCLQVNTRGSRVQS
jgi:hypothetical protein